MLPFAVKSCACRLGGAVCPRASTIAENKRESVKIVIAFGHLQHDEITKTMGYEYLDACEAGGRSEKGNKEISLARVILEYGVRLGMIEANPFDGLRKNKTVTKQHYVENSDLSLALELADLWVARITYRRCA